MTSLHT
jgi:hypothetical protein